MSMQRLSDLLEGVPGLRVRGSDAVPIAEVRDDSRLVGPGDLFVAVAGAKEDGRKFIEAALAKGASAVVTDGDPGNAGDSPVTWVIADSARQALGKIAANRHGAAS